MTTFPMRKLRLPIAAAALLLPGCSGDGPSARPSRDDKVVIHRDDMGVPHVYGRTDRAVLFGAGYAMAQDRLFQLYTICRLGKGRLAEILGPDALETDRSMRETGYTDAEWQAMVDAVPDPYRSLLEAALDGINAYLREALAEPEEKLPYEFQALGIELEPLELTDFAAGIGYVTSYFGGGGGYELQNLEMWRDLVERHGEQRARTIFDDILVLDDPDAYTSVPAEHAPSLAADAGSRPFATAAAMGGSSLPRPTPAAGRRGGGTRGASRAIAIGPGRSASGNVLMMQATADGVDLHLSGGGFDVAGLAVPPLPLPVMGRTPTYGWLITTGENDMADIYEEQLDPANRYRYRFEGEWREMEVRTEIIRVRGAQPETFEVARTVHGPVIAWDAEGRHAWSLRTRQWKSVLDGLPATIDRARSTSFEEFEQAIRSDRTNSWNVVYGDVEGRIAYWHTGAVPIRAPGADPRLPLPGTGEHEWTGFRDPAAWPTATDPSQGYLLSWNNKPDRNTRYGDMARWGKHYRTYLPKALIEADESIALEELHEMNRILGAGFGSVELETTTPEFFLPHLAAAVADADTDAARLGRMVELMADWNGLYEDGDGDGFYDHAGLTIHRAWVATALKALFEDDIGDWWQRFDEDIYIKYRTSLLLRALEGDAAGRPMTWDFFGGEDANSFLRRTLRLTSSELSTRYDTENVEDWRHEAFKRRFGEDDPSMFAALALGHIPAETPHNGMPEWTAVMELGALPARLQSATPSGGQSRFIDLDGNPSPHIADQVRRHLEFDLKTVWLDEAMVTAEAVSSSTIEVPRP